MTLPENPDAETAASRAAALEELTLILVRHGETAYNAEGRIQGHRDVPLSPTGRAQAARLARRLARLWETNIDHSLPPPSAVFSSDLVRASETAEILREGVPSLRSLPFRTTPLLRERHFGDWQGLTAEEVLAARIAHGSDSPPNGETWPQVADRMIHALTLLQTETPSTPHRAALVTGHGGSLRLFLTHALQIGPEAAHAFRLGNTSLSLLHLHPAHPARILRLNDMAHLED